MSEERTSEQQAQHQRVVDATARLQSLQEQIEAAKEELETATQERDWGAVSGVGRRFVENRYAHARR